jgi:hypothetical protein
MEWIIKQFKNKNIMTIIFQKLGFNVSNSGILCTTNRFARLIANMAVREGRLMLLCKDVYSKNIR